jgi:hypothetical protein
MNVATRLMLEQMQKDIEALKERVSQLERVATPELTTREVCEALQAGKKTLTLPEKRKSA